MPGKKFLRKAIILSFILVQILLWRSYCNIKSEFDLNKDQKNLVELSMVDFHAGYQIIIKNYGGIQLKYNFDMAGTNIQLEKQLSDRDFEELKRFLLRSNLIILPDNANWFFRVNSDDLTEYSLIINTEKGPKTICSNFINEGNLKKVIEKLFGFTVEYDMWNQK